MRARRATLVGLAALAASFVGAGCGKGKPVAAPARDFVELTDAKSRLEHRAMPDYRRYCSFCHGNEGKGDGINAFNLATKPRDFTDSKQGKAKTAADAATVIRKGSGVPGISHDMPAWGRSLTDEQVNGLADLVLGFGAKRGD